MHGTTEYVQAMVRPLMTDAGYRGIEDAVSDSELRITVFVTTSRAKSVVIGRGGENIHAIQHLARERQSRDDPRLKVRIDVILAGSE